nr:ATP-grasp fold amidoligase family protein [uncultured Dongia sp.]
MIGTAREFPLRLMRRIHRTLSRTLPNVWQLNYLLALPKFWSGNKRLPRRIDDPRASLNDIIFQRMIRNEWSMLEQSCVDKEHAKVFAQAKAPHVKVARTEAVMVLGKATTIADVAAWLQPFLGKRLVVKPTHSCGAILYLDTPLDPAELAAFVRFSKKNFFHAARETQYQSLERKLIIEQNIAPAGGLSDYKFTCANGHILHGRLDVGRFTSQHQRALFTVPGFEIIPVEYGGLKMPAKIERPPHLYEMIEIAAQLSHGFDFVRIDLYDTDDGVYFGEFTFTPCAGSSSYSDEEVAIELARRLRKITASETRMPLQQRSAA